MAWAYLRRHPTHVMSIEPPVHEQIVLDAQQQPGVGYVLEQEAMRREGRSRRLGLGFAQGSGEKQIEV